MVEEQRRRLAVERTEAPAPTGDGASRAPACGASTWPGPDPRPVTGGPPGPGSTPGPDAVGAAYPAQTPGVGGDVAGDDPRRPRGGQAARPPRAARRSEGCPDDCSAGASEVSFEASPSDVGRGLADLLPGAFADADRDRAGGLLGRLRYPDLEHAVLVRGADGVGVDAVGQDELTLERAVPPFDEGAAVLLGLLGQVPLGGDPQHVVVHLDRHVLGPNAGQVDADDGPGVGAERRRSAGPTPVPGGSSPVRGPRARAAPGPARPRGPSAPPSPSAIGSPPSSHR